MKTKDLVVKVQTLNGAWEHLGVDRVAGVWPEGVSLVSDDWGSKTASFTLKRYVPYMWPDLRAFAPVDVEVGGKLVWSGFIMGSPSRSGEGLSVQCVGWQAHLDEDLYEGFYVHTNMGEWQDAKSWPAFDPSSLGSGGKVVVGGGNILIGWDKTDTMVNNKRSGVFLDLGENVKAARCVVNYNWTNGSGNGNQFLNIHFGDDPVAGLTLANSATNPVGTNQALAGNGTGRFVLISWYQGAGGDLTNIAGDCFLEITGITVFASTTYDAGTGSSQLKAHQIVTDALSKATSRLSSDTSLIDTSATWFSIPEFAPTGPRTARQAWENADAFENRYKKIDVYRRPVYKAMPTAPAIEVGAWSDVVFDDTSSGDGTDIYNYVLGTGTLPTGDPFSISRGQGDNTAYPAEGITSPAPTNPGAEVNATGWTAYGVGTPAVARTTTLGEFQQGVGGIKLTNGTGGTTDMGAYTTFTGTFLRGVTYELSYFAKTTAPSGSWPAYVAFGKIPTAALTAALSTATVQQNDMVQKFQGTPTTSFVQYSIRWTPLADTPAANVYAQFDFHNLEAPMFIDNLTLGVVKPTLPDKWGFKRTQELSIGFTITKAAARQIMDRWLQAHTTAAFKGTCTITGGNAVRNVFNGLNLEPEDLLQYTNELMRFSDQIDPDTGAHGRDGRIVEVTYTHETDTAEVTIDSSSSNFERLLERIGIYVNQLRS